MSDTISTHNIYNQLKADFPAHAYSVDNSRGFALTSIRAQYVSERLNEVLGITGWEFSGDYQEVDAGVLFHGTLFIQIGEHHRNVTHTGFSAKKKNLGDTYKSARTDCLNKCASVIGVGNEVFKGNIEAVNNGKAFKQKNRQESNVQPDRGATGADGVLERLRRAAGKTADVATDHSGASGPSGPANNTDSRPAKLTTFDPKVTDHLKLLEETYRKIWRDAKGNLDTYEEHKKKNGKAIVKHATGTPLGMLEAKLRTFEA